jgi:hypothetical protein
MRQMGTALLCGDERSTAKVDTPRMGAKAGKGANVGSEWMERMPSGDVIRGAKGQPGTDKL